MSFIGKIPANAALTASDLADGIITEAKMADDAISLTELKAGTDGNIISYDASGNPVAIATGSDGQVLTSTGAGSPPAFEAAAAGGKILQVINGSFATESTISNGQTFTAFSTSLDLVITPSATNSKILINYTFGVLDCDADQGAVKIRYKVDAGSYADVTPIGASTNVTRNIGHMGLPHHPNVHIHNAGSSISIVHSPSSTGALTYTPFFINEGTGGDTFLNRNERFTDGSDPTAPTFFYAMEIGA
jgi:hypothetical protein